MYYIYHICYKTNRSLDGLLLYDSESRRRNVGSTSDAVFGQGVSHVFLPVTHSEGEPEIIHVEPRDVALLQRLQARTVNTGSNHDNTQWNRHNVRNKQELKGVIW